MNLPVPTASRIETRHYQEWINSGVSPDIIEQCVVSLKDQSPYDYLIYSKDVDRRNDGRVVNWVLKRYQHIEDGGWWCSGEDLVELKKHIVERRINNRANEFIEFVQQFKMEWGQFKPDSPIEKDGKVIKYEAPPKTETRVFAAQTNNPRFWLEVLINPEIPIIITEGAKKGGCLVSIGYASISLPGIFNGYRKATKRLIEDLAVICAKGRPIYICFDHDTKEQTRRNVNIAISRLGRLFAMQGCQVNIIELPGPEKGVDDFVVARGREAFDFEFQNAIPLHQWQTRLYSRLTYKVDLELNQDKLGPFSITGSRPKLLCVKSPKGSGKTYSLEQVVRDAKERGQRVIVITHRVQLGQDICRRIGLPYVTEVGVTRTSAPNGYGLCIDSLHPESQAQFDPEDWEDAIVIIDEVEQVLWHLFNAKTEVNRHRIPILEQLHELLLQTFRSQNGQVILMDADLTDVSINFVLKVSGMQFAIDPFVIVNNWKQQDYRTCRHYNQSNPKEWLASLIQAIALGQKCFVVTQGQKVKSVWSATNLEYVISMLVPDCKILCIDSETIADPNHKAYGVIDRLNLVLDQYDVVIATPTIETGVSIDIQNHFDSVWGCFWGVSPSNSARQALARVRANIPRHVWAVKHSNCGKIAGGATTKYALQSGLAEIAKASLARLQQWWDSEDGYHTDEAALHTWAEMACRINTEMIHYRDSMIKGLEAEGYRIEEAGFEASEDLAFLMIEWLGSDSISMLDPSPKLLRFEAIRFCLESLRGVRKERYAAQMQEIANAELISDDEGDFLKNKRNKTHEERLKYRKWILHKKYGGVEVTAELVEKDDDGWHSKLKLDYSCGIGRQFVDDKDVKLLNLMSRNHKLWYPVLVAKQMGMKVQLLEYLGIPELIQSGQVYSNADEIPQSIEEKARIYAQSVKQLFGINVCENDTPMRLIGKFVKLFGMKLITQERPGKRGVSRDRFYLIAPVEDGREEVLRRWFERDTTSRNESAVSTTFNINNREVAA